MSGIGYRGGLVEGKHFAQIGRVCERREMRVEVFFAKDRKVITAVLQMYDDEKDYAILTKVNNFSPEVLNH